MSFPKPSWWNWARNIRRPTTLSKAEESTPLEILNRPKLVTTSKET